MAQPCSSNYENPADAFASVPFELRSRHQWVMWRYGYRGKKQTKIPYMINGRLAKSNDPNTWASFGAATTEHTRGRYDGIGYVFSADDPFCGIDLDRSLDEHGAPLPWAAPIVKELDSYTEVSPSGKGVKIWVKGQLDERTQHTVKYGTGQVELYDRGRFFTVTGARVAETEECIRERQPALNWLRQLLAAAKPKALRTSPTIRSSDDVPTAIEAIEHLSAIRAEEYNLWLAVGMAAFTVSSGLEMLAAWDRFSRRSDKHVAGETARKWQSFSGGPSEIGQLIAWAKQDSGWTPKHHVIPNPIEVADPNSHHEWPDPLPLPVGLTPRRPRAMTSRESLPITVPTLLNAAQAIARFRVKFDKDGTEMNIIPAAASRRRTRHRGSAAAR